MYQSKFYSCKLPQNARSMSTTERRSFDRCATEYSVEYSINALYSIIMWNNWFAVQNLRIAVKKAVFALGFKKPSVIAL